MKRRGDLRDIWRTGAQWLIKMIVEGTVSILKKTLIFLSLLFCMYADASAHAASIEFSLDDLVVSQDFADVFAPIYRVVPLDDERYKSLAAKFLIQDAEITLTSDDVYRIMLVCSEANKAGVYRGIQLLVVDDRKESARVVQRIKLSDGDTPQLLLPSRSGNIGDLMVRVIRSGNNSECYVYHVHPASGKLTETMRINRAFVERMKLSVKATMQADGYIEVVSQTPPFDERVDLSEALNALIEDELYQENGRPVPSLVNLTCVRNGWEEERIFMQNGEVRLEVGLSMMTLSKKQVLDAILTYDKGEDGRWRAQEIRFEPFLPYKW